MMRSPAQVNVSAIIDDARIGRFQWMIFLLCGLCLIMDGFDVQALGYIAPALIREWKIPNYALGPVFSAALVGVLFGALLCSMLADKIGRRPVLIVGALYFGVLTVATARVTSLEQMLIVRFIAGIGLGGIMPNAMALVGEYSPKRAKITALMVISCGFTAGAAIGGFIAAWLIPAYGWRSVFYFGGSIPLILAVLMAFLLPESLQFLVLEGKVLRGRGLQSKDAIKIARWLRRIDPGAPAGGDVEYVVAEVRRHGVPAVHLFREGRTAVTILLWIINFMNLLNLYFLASWVPTVVRDAGYTTAIAVLVGTTVQIGGTIGAFGNGWLIGRAGFARALSSIFAVGSVSISMIGQPFLSLPLLFLAVFVAGWCVTGGQPGVNTLAAVYYPTNLRSTGIGWSLGIGRIGAIIGPVVGGRLMALRWTSREVFYAAAVPAAISAVVMLILGRVMKTPARADVRSEVPVH
jgi:AAHS family 4-hydroxybenzoate transporter-like MFS transporter